MTEVRSSNKNRAPKNNKSNLNQEKPSRKREEFNLDLSSLTYEESLEKLNGILERLQNDEIVLEKLNNEFIYGQMYIKHCEHLLNKIEQEIKQIEIDEL